MANTEQTEQERDSFQERHKDELSVGAYAKKQIYDIFVSFGSMAGGAAIGRMLAPKTETRLRDFVKDSSFSKEGESKNVSTQYSADEKDKLFTKASYMFAGFLVGGMIGGIVQGYSRWKKGHEERLGVEEINKDISEMRPKMPTDEALIEKNTRLEEMLAEETSKTQALEEQLAKRQTPAAELAKAGGKTPLEHSKTAGTAQIAMS